MEEQDLASQGAHPRGELGLVRGWSGAAGLERKTGGRNREEQQEPLSASSRSSRRRLRTKAQFRRCFS